MCVSLFLAFCSYDFDSRLWCTHCDVALSGLPANAAMQGLTSSLIILIRVSAATSQSTIRRDSLSDPQFSFL